MESLWSALLGLLVRSLLLWMLSATDGVKSFAMHVMTHPLSLGVLVLLVVVRFTMTISSYAAGTLRLAQQK